jgi:pyruvate dehydrogenase E1 component
MLLDSDPQETKEWLDALDSVIQFNGQERAHFLVSHLIDKATSSGIALQNAVTTPFHNTIAPHQEKLMPGDLFMERRIRSLIRWNALAMVVRANTKNSGIGGHITTFSSSATLYDVGFNYFFHGRGSGHLGDLVYFQGHSSPGIYARSFLEGRLTEEQLENFRLEVDGNGLSSYPHPWLMPDYWQFPTVSMGLGPIQAIYQAHVMQYQHSRGLIDQNNRKVWCFLGDGECDEPESLGAISLAGREKLENLIFVVNCNLQRLDGPVRGNGKIIQELEGVFRGAGWNVIKVVWGRLWDQLLEKDTTGLLQRRMDEVVDGELQNYKANGGAYTREHFFGKYPELLELVKDISDDEIMYLNRGGHDPYKVYAAYANAMETKDKPTVILAMTVKGYGLGSSGGEAQNEAHSVKSLDKDEMKRFRDRFDIPISDEDLVNVPYYRPPNDSPEIQYMHAQRQKLGGYLPARVSDYDSLTVPDLTKFESQLTGTGTREISSTMAFVRVLSTLIKDKNIGSKIVPIVPDEARTFGMEGMFRQLGIYSSQGQRYTPQDAGQIMYYKESKEGQILEEGITEAGAFSAWLAVGTSYANHKMPLIPFYIFYSMFGFQRVMDLCWAAGDSQARGFLIGGTSGRTTLNGEGLQHQDGHSHLLANMIPNCVSYDPTYSYEVAVIIQDGIKRMYHDKENIFYYITVMNENYPHPVMPTGCEANIIKGLYKIQGMTDETSKLKVQLLGSGAILREIEAAAEILKENYNVDANVWSATSINQLQRDGMDCERWNRLHPLESPKTSFASQQLNQINAPVICATDYIKAYGEQLRPYINCRYVVLGTDGYGRSDTRQKLREHFEVDRKHIVVAALKSLSDDGVITATEVNQAIINMEIETNGLNPLYK